MQLRSAYKWVFLLGHVLLNEYVIIIIQLTSKRKELSKPNLRLYRLHHHVTSFFKIKDYSYFCVCFSVTVLWVLNVFLNYRLIKIFLISGRVLMMKIGQLIPQLSIRKQRIASHQKQVLCQLWIKYRAEFLLFCFSLDSSFKKFESSQESSCFNLFKFFFWGAHSFFVLRAPFNFFWMQIEALAMQQAVNNLPVSGGKKGKKGKR